MGWGPDMADGGFFGGLVGGFSNARELDLAQQKQDFLNQTQLTTQTTQQIDATLQQIGTLAKAYSDAGKDPSTLWQNPAVQTMVESAQRLAVGIGMDPQRIASMAQAATLRPPLEDASTKGTKVGPGETIIGNNGQVLYRSEALTGNPIIVGGKPVENTNLTAPGNTITGTSVTPLPNNPPPVPGAAPNAASVSAPVQQAAFGPGALPDQGAPSAVPSVPSAPAAPNGPTLPPNMQPGIEAIDYALKNNITGPEFIKALPPIFRNSVSDVMAYKMDPEKFSKRIPPGQNQSEYTRIMSWVHQASNGEYDAKFYKPIQKVITEFTSGGLNSPAAQLTAGNTAIQHLGDMADAYDKMQAIPGLLDKIAKSGTSIASYAAKQLQNRVIRGTSEGQALAAFLVARERYSLEIERFYAGGKGADAAVQRSQDALDAAYSPLEMYSTLNAESHLLSGKVNTLQDRWKIGMAGPRYADVAIRSAIPDFPIIQQRSESVLDRLSKGFVAAKGNISAPPGNVIDANTYFGTK